MGMLYSWASPDYLLEHLTLRQVFYYYDQALSIVSGKPTTGMLQAPDLEGFYKHYGNIIKRPKGG